VQSPQRFSSAAARQASTNPRAGRIADRIEFGGERDAVAQFEHRGPARLRQRAGRRWRTRPAVRGSVGLEPRSPTPEIAVVISSAARSTDSPRQSSRRDQILRISHQSFFRLCWGPRIHAHPLGSEKGDPAVDNKRAATTPDRRRLSQLFDKRVRRHRLPARKPRARRAYDSSKGAHEKSTICVMPLRTS